MLVGWFVLGAVGVTDDDATTAVADRGALGEDLKNDVTEAAAPAGPALNLRFA